jgi:hypothetical protein
MRFSLVPHDKFPNKQAYIVLGRDRFLLHFLQSMIHYHATIRRYAVRDYVLNCCWPCAHLFGMMNLSVIYISCTKEAQWTETGGRNVKR